MKKFYTLMAIVLLASMFLSACGSAATPAPTAMPAATQAPAATTASCCHCSHARRNSHDFSHCTRLHTGNCLLRW